MLLILVAVLVAWNSPAGAITISDIDLNTFDFDVVNYDVGSNPNGTSGDATADGTSNGIGWEISPTNLWTGRTTTNGTFSFSFLPNPTDNLHASSNFTITFDQTVNHLLVALSNDSSAPSDSINFGIAPTEVTGGVSVTGFQILLNPSSGGFALFENLNSLTVTHTNTNFLDGFDLAFHVVQDTAPVPEPATVALLGIGLAGLAGAEVRRRRKKKAVDNR